MDKLRNFGNRLAKGAVLAIGLPYGLVIIANVLCGWPCSQEGEDRYKRALQPKRVLKVAYAIAEQVDLLKFLPIYLKWTSLYKSADNLVKDIQYGVNNNKLDIWLPLQCNSENHEQSHTSNASAQLPVVVFVYGGAWGSGDKNMYGLLAQSLIEHLGVVVVIPNYSNFPKGEVRAMIQDIHDTIEYIQSSEFHQLAPSADQRSIILFGHSAGAHLCALSTVELVDQLDQQEGAAKSADCDRTNCSMEVVERERAECEHVNFHQEGDALLEKDQGIQSQSKTGELLSSIKGVIGLGGVYQIMDHYHYESQRGVEDLSPMWRVMHGLENFDKYSPMERVLKMTTQQATRLPPMCLIHGLKDGIVPPSSSEKFASSLVEREGDVTIKLIADGGHAQLIMDMMMEGRKFHHSLIGLLKEAMTKFSAV